jgi:hypothetical protein
MVITIINSISVNPPDRIIPGARPEPENRHK